jgi:hypothetical protein
MSDRVTDDLIDLACRQADGPTDAAMIPGVSSKVDPADPSLQIGLDKHAPAFRMVFVADLFTDAEGGMRPSRLSEIFYRRGD